MPADVESCLKDDCKNQIYTMIQILCLCTPYFIYYEDIKEKQEIESVDVDIGDYTVEGIKKFIGVLCDIHKKAKTMDTVKQIIRNDIHVDRPDGFSALFYSPGEDFIDFPPPDRVMIEYGINVMNHGDRILAIIAIIGLYGNDISEELTSQITPLIYEYANFVKDSGDGSDFIGALIESVRFE